MDSHVTLLTRLNTIALVVLILWIGVLSSMLMAGASRREPAVRVGAAAVTPAFIFVHWPNTSRYPTDANHIAECTGARSFTLCCANQTTIQCSLPATLVKLAGSLFDYQLDTTHVYLPSRIECQLYCLK